MNPILSKLQITSLQTPAEQIERHLRQHIQSGVLAAFTQLPTTLELASTWGVSCSVVQKVMKHLVNDGLVERRPKRGTYIKGKAEVKTIAMMMGPRLSKESEHFYRAVKEAFLEGVEKRNWRGRIYDGLNDEQGVAMSANSRVCRHLAEDLGRYTFDGMVVFATNMEEIVPLQQHSNLPYVHLATDMNAHDVKLDMEAFMRESLTYLSEKGFHRIAYLCPSLDKNGEPYGSKTIREVSRQLEIPEPTVETLSDLPTERVPEEKWYRSALRLIAEWRAAGAEAWPQAILISDDIAMRSLAMALFASGVSVPQDVFVMTYANEGIDLHYGMPVARYEISPAETVRMLLDLLEKQIGGAAMPARPIMVQGKIKEPETFAHLTDGLQTNADRT
jgi:DNA-binding LacI/PurR family transcriptional regulator